MPAGETILDAALDAGLDYPFLCRGGTCGTCKTTLLTGSVDLLPYAHFALTDAERDAGLILACRAVPLEDCEIDVLDPDADPTMAGS